jgi:hypothetical protein
LGKYLNYQICEIKLGNTELDKETLHGLQEAYLIANHMTWLKSLSENLQKHRHISALTIVRNLTVILSMLKLAN